MADAEEAPGELCDRVVHKNWKIRQEAYQELGTKFESEFDGSAPIFSEFGGFHFWVMMCHYH